MTPHRSCFFFFFQAEDGIRDVAVTGVQTCALPISFRQIDDDRRFHYLLTYTPANTDFDGQWRRISVKVPGRNVTVRARSGYLAVRSAGVLPLLTYEGPALAALEHAPLP